MTKSGCDFGIRERLSFCDKVAFWTKSPLPKRLQKKVGAKLTRRRNPKMRGFKYRYDLHQPTRATNEALSNYFDNIEEPDNEPVLLINMIEIALDFIADHPWRLHQYLQGRVIQRWHSDQMLEVYLTTTYFSERSYPNNIVIYSDRPSKLRPDEGNCVHLEWRARGARVLRSLGICTFRELTDFCYRNFWSEKLQLREVDVEKLGRIFLTEKQKRRRRKTWIKKVRGCPDYNMDMRAGQMLSRVTHSGETVHTMPTVCAQLIKDEYGKNEYVKNKNRPKKTYKSMADRSWTKLDNSHLLPDE